MVPTEGHKVLSALADLGGPGADHPAGQARVLVGSASLLASAGVKLSSDAEAHMASVQVRACSATPLAFASQFQHYPSVGCSPCTPTKLSWGAQQDRNCKLQLVTGQQGGKQRL